MSILRSEDSKKWVNTFVALLCAIFSFLLIKFFFYLGDRFDLESKMESFRVVAQAFGAVLGIVVFFTTVKNKNATKYIEEVYAELLKVIWPTNDNVTRLTVGLVIVLLIISMLFLGVDYATGRAFSLFYK